MEFKKNEGILFSVTIPSRYQNTQHFPVSSWFFLLYSSSCGGKVRRVTGHYCLAITLKDVCDIYRVIYLCCALLIVSYRRYVMLFICFYMRDQVMKTNLKTKISAFS